VICCECGAPNTARIECASNTACAQMLESIKGCHEMGYLHRDVKPSNFAMGTDENRRRCYVIDFGLSKKCVFPLPSLIVYLARAQT
jgi:serine/threonine protein kinase